jgi:3-deoxy-manno-octulosonate cytidylyltransferase (CMP-KDO synthetase)
MTENKIIARDAIASFCAERRRDKAKIVFTNGCFDILHAGHIALLEHARSLGDLLIVGLNSDASVKRLKGDDRPINGQAARARVLAALQCVDAVCIFEDDTPILLLEDVRPNVHVKGGDYVADDLPEAATVKKNGGEIVIVPFVEGFSTTRTLQKLGPHPAFGTPLPQAGEGPGVGAVIVIPARFGSTRFPGKPLAMLEDKTVITRVVEAALQTQAARPVLVATDDARIMQEIETRFAATEAQAVMTSEACQTGTDRIAEVVRARFSEKLNERLIVVNVQGDEPFINPAHLDELMRVMCERSTLRMATLATPLRPEHTSDPNVVKVVLDQNGNALYFSRLPIPFARDADEQRSTPRLHHLGVYAYEARWLLEMASLPPSPLEQTEKLEQLRALENGVDIGVVVVRDVVSIAIDTPEDLARAQEYLCAERIAA